MLKGMKIVHQFICVKDPIMFKFVSDRGNVITGSQES